MACWEPDGRVRLERAALDLFTELGYEQTTVSEIAARAGLTQLTFLRYADKRDVLFAGVRVARPDCTPLDAAIVGVAAAGTMFEGRRDLVLQRQAIITSYADLQERELSQLMTIVGCRDGSARRARRERADRSTHRRARDQVFRTAFARWVLPANRLRFVTLIRRTRADLTALAA